MTSDDLKIIENESVNATKTWVSSASARHLPLVAILLISAYWFDLFAPIQDRWSAVPTYDSVFFIKLAEQIFNLKEFGWLGYHEPCFYSLAIAALTGITGDLFVSAVLISRISVVLLPAAVFLLAAALFNRRVALAAALLLLFFPHLKAIAGTSQSEAFNVFLVTTSVYLLWQARTLKNYPLAVGAGLLFAMSYLTRSEGLFIFLLTSGALLVGSRSKDDNDRKSRNILLVALITFMLVIAPYISYLSCHYGTLTVGTKTSSIYFWVREKCFHDPDPVKTEWGLNSQGELNMISMRSRDLLAYWGRDIPRSIGVYLKNFSEQIPGRIPNDGGIKHYPQIYPLYLAIPLLLGLALLFRRGEGAFRPAGYLLSAFLLLFIYPLLTGGWWRYLINLLPLFLILSAVALDEIAAEIFHDNKSRILLAAAVAIITVYHLWIVAWQPAPQGVVTYQKNKSSVANETKKAGAWARQMIPENAVYMARWTRLPFYLKGKWIPLPDADLNEILQYASKNGAAYMLIESDTPLTASELEKSSIPGIGYIGAYQGQSIDYYCTLLNLK